MKRGLAVLVGVMLIVVGGLALAFNLLAPTVLPDFLRWEMWRLWPLIVICAGLFFVVPPFLVRGKRGLGGLFIAGVPVLANGGVGVTEYARIVVLRQKRKDGLFTPAAFRHIVFLEHRLFALAADVGPRERIARIARDRPRPAVDRQRLAH